MKFPINIQLPPNAPSSLVLNGKESLAAKNTTYVIFLVLQTFDRMTVMLGKEIYLMRMLPTPTPTPPPYVFSLAVPNGFVSGTVKIPEMFDIFSSSAVNIYVAGVVPGCFIMSASCQWIECIGGRESVSAPMKLSPRGLVVAQSSVQLGLVAESVPASFQFMSPTSNVRPSYEDSTALVEHRLQISLMFTVGQGNPQVAECFNAKVRFSCFDPSVIRPAPTVPMGNMGMGFRRPMGPINTQQVPGEFPSTATYHNYCSSKLVALIYSLITKIKSGVSNFSKGSVSFSCGNHPRIFNFHVHTSLRLAPYDGATISNQLNVNFYETTR
ncbi:hypothetical protein HDV05_006853 [Chytridiales sp. JEL 0842]|nr:hypothetical protein HDV05_006853 [Chytridiales sp. JEL 0842]